MDIIRSIYIFKNTHNTYFGISNVIDQMLVSILSIREHLRHIYQINFERCVLLKHARPTTKNKLV